jgi:hypothetical protein
MKATTLFILCLIILTSCSKQNETPLPVTQAKYFTFSGRIGNNDNSTLMAFDSNLVICGNFSGDSTTYLSILKITRAGTLIWRRDFSAGLLSQAYAVAETENHDLFLCGVTMRNYQEKRDDVIIVKTNPSGDTLWTKTYGGPDPDYGGYIIATSDGNLLIAGRTESYGAGSLGDIYLLKINTNGDTLWTRSYPDPDQEVPFHLLETQNGEFLVTGTDEDNNNPRGLYLLKVSSHGEKLWSKTIGAGMWKWGFSTIELSDGSLLTCGRYTSGGHSQVLVLKTDGQGNTTWENEYGISELSEEGASIRRNLDGTFTITGLSYNSLTTTYDVLVLKIDQDGNLVWFNTFGNSKMSWGMNLIKDRDDNNLITGEYNDSILVTRINTDGAF